MPLALPAELPLEGKRVLITAPRNYAARLAPELISRGAKVLVCPAIRIAPLDEPSYAPLDAALSGAAGFAWCAFTSRNGIEAFLRRCRRLGLEPAAALEGAGCQVAALGRDAELLREHGVRVALAPAEPSPAGITRELAAMPGCVAGQRILVPAPRVVGLPEPNVVPDFVRGLGGIGMEVVRVDAYETRQQTAAELELPELRLLREGAVDAVAISSTCEIHGLLSDDADGRR